MDGGGLTQPEAEALMAEFKTINSSSTATPSSFFSRKHVHKRLRFSKLLLDEWFLSLSFDRG